MTRTRTCLRALDGADVINGNDGDDTIIPNRPANADGTANTAANDTDNMGDGATVDGEDIVDGGEGNGHDKL